MGSEPAGPVAPTKTLGDRIRWLGVLSWSLLGILALAYVVWRYMLAPIAIVVAPLAIATVIVFLLNPIVSALERRGMRRGFGVLIVYVLFLASVGTALAFLIPLIGRQLTAFIDALPGYVNTVVDRVNEFAEARGFDARLDIRPEDVFEAIQQNRETIVSLLGGVQSFAGQILHVLITFVVGIFLSIYLLLDLPKIGAWFRRVLPARNLAELSQLGAKVNTAVGGFFRGQLLVATFVGVTSAIGLSLVKLPFALLIGLLAGVLNLIPLIGPFLAAIPAVLVGLLSGVPSRALWAAVVLLIVQQVDNHVVSPNVMGRTVRLHPVTVMLAMLVGATLAGILGMLVVIPSVAAIKIVAAHLWHKRFDLGLTERPAEAG
ncbi:MAG TPA: AI-2E family transporter [Actinomycetota bacterium]